MTKPGDTTDTDKYIYSGYGLGFESTGQFSHPQGGMARNIIIFGVDLSNSVHATKKKNILILGHGLTQKVNNTQFMQKKYIYLILVQKIKYFTQVYIIMVMTVIYLSMVKKSLNLKPKNLKLKLTN